MVPWRSPIWARNRAYPISRCVADGKAAKSVFEVARQISGLGLPRVRSMADYVIFHIISQVRRTVGRDRPALLNRCCHLAISRSINATWGTAMTIADQKETQNPP